MAENYVTPFPFLSLSQILELEERLGNEQARGLK